MNPISIIGSIGRDIIDGVFKKKEDKVNANIVLEKIKSQGELSNGVQQINAFAEEERSKDKFIRRVRPAGLYLLYAHVSLAWACAIVNVFDHSAAVSMVGGASMWLTAIPKEMWQAFIACYGIYAGVRTIDKIKKSTNG